MKRIILLTLLSVGCHKQVPPPEFTEAVKSEVTNSPQAQLTDGEAVKALIRNFERVYFDFDSHVLTNESKEALSRNAAILQKHPRLTVEIQGHCDERGTVDYNVALGDRRASAIRKHLTLLGVADDQLRTISFGKEIPLDQGGGEVAWSKNRRAEFRVMFTPEIDDGEEAVGTVP